LSSVQHKEQAAEPGADQKKAAGEARQVQSEPSIGPGVAFAPGSLIALQRLAGNAAVGQLLDRQREPMPTLQRDLPVPETMVLTNREMIDRALKKKDPAYVKEIRDLTEATPAERIQLIDILVHQWWVGPFDEMALETLWKSFKDDLLTVASKNADLWQLSLRKGAELYKLEPAKKISDKFIEDVRAIGKGHLDSNEKYCRDELKQIGADASQQPVASESHNRLVELQTAAQTILKAREGQQKLRGVQVGWEFYDEDTGYHAQRPAYFFPGVQLDPTALGPQGAPPVVPLRDAQATHDTFEAVINGLMAQYPALYSVNASDNPDALKRTAEDPNQAYFQVKLAINGVLEHIDNTRPKMDGNLPYKLQPVHGQLMSGQIKGPSGIDWKDVVAQPLAEQVIEVYDEQHMLADLGIATLAAAAFIAAEFATGGLATFALVAAGMTIGVGQAAVSWERRYELAQAHGASTSKETELVSEGQVTMATIEAVLNTALVFVDAALAAKTLGRLGSSAATVAGRRAASEAIEALARLSKLAPAEAAPAIEKGVAELGVESVVGRTGKSAGELLAVVGEHSPVAGRLKAFAALPENLLKMSAKDLGEQVSKLAQIAKADPAAAEAIAAASVERLGPQQTLRQAGGWKKLSTVLGNNSAAGKAVMTWRDSMMVEIEAYVRTLPGGAEATGEAAVKRTGSMGNFTNDFDVSLLGANSSANRAALRSFVAARAGVAEDQLGTLLLADFFTDPRRLHLYDLLGPELRQEVARRSEKMAEANIFAKTLHDAEQAGNQELVAELRAQMKSLGVEEVAFKPLGEADRTALYARIDELHGQLETAVKNGDLAAQKQLAQQIGDTQGLINAAEGGGYFSGGAGRQIVTAKEGLLKGGTELLSEQKYTALLDQLPKLYEQSNTLLKTGYVATEKAADAIKGIAKYGGRFRTLMSDMGVEVVAEARWNQLADKFAKLLKQAKGTADVSLLQRLATESAAVQAEVEALLGEFGASSQEVLAKLSAEAGMKNVPADLAKLQFLTMANAKYLRASAALKEAMVQASSNLARMASTGALGTAGGPGSKD